MLCMDKTGTLTEDRVAYAYAVDIDGRPDDQVDTYAYVAAAFQALPYNQLDAALADLLCADDQVVVRARFTKITESPFDVYKRRSTVVVQEQSDERIVITKGDPDAILGLCSHVQVAGIVTELSSDLADQGRDLVASYEKQGVRVLAVAAKAIAVSSRFEESPTDVNGMVLVGFVGFVDPIKSTAAAAVRQLGSGRCQRESADRGCAEGCGIFLRDGWVTGRPHRDRRRHRQAVGCPPRRNCLSENGIRQN